MKLHYSKSPLRATSGGFEEYKSSQSPGCWWRLLFHCCRHGGPGALHFWLLAETAPSNSSRLGVVLWRFRTTAAHEHAERRAARITGSLLFVLAAYVTVASAFSLLGYSVPEPTVMGVVILLLAATVMPWLAREKRRLSTATCSAALRADAAESATCAYLAVIALAGVVINAVWHFRWADPIAALVILPLIIWEGREAIRGQACGGC